MQGYEKEINMHMILVEEKVNKEFPFQFDLKN